MSGRGSLRRVVVTGMGVVSPLGNDVETAVDSIFKALEKDQFYILDTPKYERLLCEQGVFEAEKVRPVDYYTLN